MSSDEKSLSMIQAEFKFNFIYNSEMANGKWQVVAFLCCSTEHFHFDCYKCRSVSVFRFSKFKITRVLQFLLCRTTVDSVEL